MNKILNIFRVFPTYLAASSYGRRYLRALGKNIRGKESGPTTDFLLDRWQRSLLMRNFLVCDRCFNQWIPDSILSSSGDDRFRIYLRFIPFSWVGQAIRTRILSAFDLEYDRAAEERSVLQSFIHREANDLIDHHGLPMLELYKVLLHPSGPLQPEMARLRSIWKRFKQLAPREKFPNYHRIVDERRQLLSRPRPRTPETAAQYTAQNGHFSARLSLYIMRDVLPESLESILATFGLWLYCLDEFSDLERDARIKRATYMSTVKEPEKELLRLYKEMEEQVTAAAPHPRRLLDYLDILNRDILRLKQQGIDIESRLLHVD